MYITYIQVKIHMFTLHTKYAQAHRKQWWKIEVYLMQISWFTLKLKNSPFIVQNVVMAV